MSEEMNEKNLDEAAEAVEEVKPEEDKEPAGEKPAEPEKAEETPEEEAVEKVDEMEQESLYQLQLFKEAGNEANDKAVNDAAEALKKIFEDLRGWLKTNSDPEVVKAHLQKAADDANRILQTTKQKVIEVSDSEQFKKTMEAGKDFVIGTGTMIADGVKYTADQLMKNPTVHKTVTDLDEKLDVLRDSKVLQDVVNKTEDAVDKLNAAIFSGLKSFFHKPEPEPEKEEKPESGPETKED